jgi:L-ascorbate metabolism protein UlaG (beta-lactamase superfamily)
MRKTIWIWVRRSLLAVGALVSLAFGALVIDGWAAFGRRAQGARQARMAKSPQWHDGKFQNTQPLWNDGWKMITGLFKASKQGSPPAGTVATVSGDAQRFATPPPSGLRVTWLGHSTMLLEIDGLRVLTDPVWGPRTSPVSWAGPKRWYDPPLKLEELPRLDAVVISHDHYDHLDYPTITAMKDWDTTFIVPLGVAAHLVHWGVPESRIVELDWWDRTRVGQDRSGAGGLEIVCTPARHASGRAVIDTNATLWAGYALLGPAHRVYFSGDTGLFPAMKDIGQRLGPFDLTMIEAGAYDQAWPDWHIGPEQAVVAHRMVGGKVMLPIHWGLVNLAYHSWTEPIERVLAAGKTAGVTVLAPRPGQSIEPSAPPVLARWWPSDVEWKTAAQRPIVSTGVTPPPEALVAEPSR